MSMAPQELEKSASKYAAAAIKADSQGAVGMAMSDYQNASDISFEINPALSYKQSKQDLQN